MTNAELIDSTLESRPGASAAFGPASTQHGFDHQRTQKIERDDHQLCSCCFTARRESGRVYITLLALLRSEFGEHDPELLVDEFRETGQ